jgi:hypothetical protein
MTAPLQSKSSQLAPAQRYAPELSFPAYSYVTGKFPHPISDPAGHSFGHPAGRARRPSSEAWLASVEYRFGIDLFNYGYYWEAHEAWEALWHACDRHSEAADFFKCLIKLAAAGVKVREGRPLGATRHIARAVELLALVRERLNPPPRRYFGLELNELAANLSQAAATIESANPADLVAAVPVKIVFPFQLRPE